LHAARPLAPTIDGPRALSLTTTSDYRLSTIDYRLMITPFVIAQLCMLGFVFFMLLNSAAVMVYVERKVAARIQQRMGPWLVGPYGALQPLADIVKLMFKEELRPKAADSVLFVLAPIISAVAAFTAL